MRKRHLLACFLVGGCASSGALQRVDERLWQAVPEPQRLAIEQKDAREIARAQDEQRGAQAALAEAKRVAAPHTPEPRATDETQRKALARVARAQSAAQRSRIEWREQLITVADLHVAVARARLELDRAETVAVRNPDEDVDPAPFRGQYARLHQDWSAARDRATALRARADDLDRDVFAAKADYARTCTAVPPPAVAAQ